MQLLRHLGDQSSSIGDMVAAMERVNDTIGCSHRDSNEVTEAFREARAAGRNLTTALHNLASICSDRLKADSNNAR